MLSPESPKSPAVTTLYTASRARHGAPGLTAPAVNSEDGREQLREKNGQGDPP